MDISSHRGLVFSNVIWACAIAAALGAALLKGISLDVLLPYAGVALFPAVMGLLLWPFARAEWAQMLVIFSWIGLAIVASFAISFVPMAVLFLCAPLAAALFEREKVIEAMVLSAIFAAIVFYAGKFGYGPEPIANAIQSGWGEVAGIMATIAFMLGAMFSVSSREEGKTNAALQDAAAPHVPPSHSGFAQAYPGAALKFDGDGRLLSATDNALSLFSLSGKNMGSLNISELMPDNDDSANELSDAFAKTGLTGLPEHITISAPRDFQNEMDRPSKISFDLVPQADGSVFAFGSDQSSDVQKLSELEHAQASAAMQAQEKTLFFAGVSHELRTPLNAIIGFSDMMRSRLFGPLPGKYAEYADLIHDSGQHMLDLIGDVLDLSKVEAGKYELHYGEFDVADVVRSSLKMLRPSADAAEVALDAEIAAEKDLLIDADRKAVRQILLNLLSNAVKFTPKGGRVVVKTRIEEDMLHIDVEDNGVGMNSADLEKIGTPYSQADNAQLITTRGSGLGLSLVKTLADLHGGQFNITSHPGAGTKASVSLPVNKADL